jgi:hypothetical protein
MSDPDNSQNQEAVTPERRSAPEEEPVSAELKRSVEGTKFKGVVLPAKKYRLKIALLFLDVWATIVFGYGCMVLNIVDDVKNENFSWVSLRMIANYIVLGITLAAFIAGFILFKTKSVRTRIERDNELRQDQNIGVWLTTFDWTWLVLFVPSMVILIICGIAGYIINWSIPEANAANLIVHRALGGFAFGFLCLNAAVVIFKLTPTRVLVLLLTIGGFCLILLLMGPRIFLNFFERFKHLGVKVDPLGYLLMAYVGFFFLRLIWIAGLFEYMAMSPNRLDLQMGLSESERGIQRKDFRVSIDTEDVILRLFKVGRIIISFPQSDRLPMSYLVTRIDKKARYAIEAASVISIGRAQQSG